MKRWVVIYCVGTACRRGSVERCVCYGDGCTVEKMDAIPSFGTASPGTEEFVIPPLYSWLTPMHTY